MTKITTITALTAPAPPGVGPTSVDLGAALTQVEVLLLGGARGRVEQDGAALPAGVDLQIGFTAATSTLGACGWRRSGEAQRLQSVLQLLHLRLQALPFVGQSRHVHRRQGRLNRGGGGIK